MRLDRLLSNLGYDPVYGARPLKRVLQQKLENALAKQLISGGLIAGGKVVADAKDGQLVFESEAAPAEKA